MCVIGVYLRAHFFDALVNGVSLYKRFKFKVGNFSFHATKVEKKVQKPELSK